MPNKENLQKAIDTMPDELIACCYSVNGCYCALGHMMNIAGIAVNTFEQDEKLNGSFIDADNHISNAEQLCEFYGLNTEQLISIQCTNDDSPSEFRVKIVSKQLQQYISEQEQQNV